MWSFNRKDEKEKLLGLKRIKLGGIKFVIKKINPFIDFPAGQIPQIFSDVTFKRDLRTDYNPTEIEIRQLHKSIIPILEAGIYRPILSPIGVGTNKGREEGLTVLDLFIDKSMAYELFQKIMDHSLNRFKGLIGVFFSIRIKRWLSTQWQIDMAKVQYKSFSQMESIRN